MKKNQVWKFFADAESYKGVYIANKEEKKWFKEIKKAHLYKYLSVKDIWKPILVLETGNSSKRADILDILGTSLVFTEKAKSILEKYLGDSVEYLPLINPDKQYYFVNVLKEIDCMDKSKTDYDEEKNEDGSTYYFVRKHPVFNIESLKEEYLFRLPFVKPYFYYTNLFKELCDKHDLNGLYYTSNELLQEF